MKDNLIVSAGIGVINGRITHGELENYTWGEIRRMTSSMKSKENSTGNPKCVMCYRDALWYKEAASVIKNNIDDNIRSNVSIKINRSIDGYPMPISLDMPSFVMLSFSCELFLKSIIYCVDDPKNECEHHLRKLLKKLDDETILEIKGKTGETDSFDKDIAEYGKPFVDYRYAFEKQSEIIDTSFIEALSDSLKAVAADRINEFISRIDG